MVGYGAVGFCVVGRSWFAQSPWMGVNAASPLGAGAGAGAGAA